MTAANQASRVRAERGAAAMLTAFGIAGIVGARALPFGDVTRPGAGFFPMCLAVLLTAVAGAVLLRTIAVRAPGTAGSDATRRGLARAAATLVALLGYVVLLQHVGFGVATFVLVAFLFRAIEPQRWPIALGGAVATVVVTHVVFQVWLRVRLPIGPWGF